MIVTEAAGRLARQLRDQYGPLLFHQSGGCCDGSSPMCFPEGEFKVGHEDVRVGAIAGCSFWMWAMQYEYFANSQIVIDVVPGRGAGFSLESPEGVRFLTRSRLFTDQELNQLEAQGPPPHAQDAPTSPAI